MNTNKCTTPPEGWYCTREAGHEGPCAAHQLPAPIHLWLRPHDGRTRITQPGSIVDQDASWQVVGELVLRRPEAEHNARLYGAINNLMAHIGAHGVAYDYDLRVVEVMDALRAIDGGTFQPGLATEAAAMAATVPARSEQQIVDQTEALADMLMKAFHRREKADPLSTYRGTQDTRARQCWLMACEIQEMLTDTDPENAAAEVDDDGAAQAPVAGQPAEPSPADPIRSLLQAHEDLIEQGENYAYFELAYTRRTGWMAWLTDRPASGEPGTAEYAKSRKVIARGQGDSAEEACQDALDVMRTPKGDSNG